MDSRSSEQELPRVWTDPEGNNRVWHVIFIIFDLSVSNGFMTETGIQGAVGMDDLLQVSSCVHSIIKNTIAKVSKTIMEAQIEREPNTMTLFASAKESCLGIFVWFQKHIQYVASSYVSLVIRIEHNTHTNSLLWVMINCVEGPTMEQSTSRRQKKGCHRFEGICGQTNMSEMLPPEV